VLLAGIYGVYLRDIIDPILEINDKIFIQDLRNEIQNRMCKEIALAITCICGESAEKFHEKFGDIRRNIKLSGLEKLGITIPDEIVVHNVSKAPYELDYLERDGIAAAVVADTYLVILGREIEINFRGKSIRPRIFAISKFKEYAERAPRYYNEVCLGERILLNKIARKALGLENIEMRYNARIKIVLKSLNK